MKGEANLSVGAVSKRAGIPISTLHFYEEKGLIFSQRNAGNQRRFHKEVLRRVSVIKAAQKLGVSLESIKAAFATLPESRVPTQNDWQKLSKAWQTELNERIQKLQRLSDMLTGCIGCGCLSMAKCPLYNEDDHLSQNGNGPILLDK